MSREWAEKWTSLDGSSYSVEKSRFISNWENKGEVDSRESRLFVWGVSDKKDGMEWVLMSAPLWKVPAYGGRPLSTLPFQTTVSQATEAILRKD